MTSSFSADPAVLDGQWKRPTQPPPPVAPRATPARRKAPKMKPVIRLCTERLLVENATHLGCDYQEREVAILKVWFDYGSMRVRLADAREGFFLAEDAGVSHVERDRGAELNAQCVLESFGAVELSCLEEMGIAANADADYLVSISDNVHALCSFSAYAIPQLMKLGWEVQIDKKYPYQVVGTQVPWYADIEPEDPDAKQQDDWFSLELGVELDGERYNLLPALLEVLNDAPDKADGTPSESLASLFRANARYRALQLSPNQYVVLPPERLKLLLAVLEELHGREDQVKFNGACAAVVARLEDAFGDDIEEEPSELTWSGRTDVVERGQGLLTPPAPETVQVARGLKAELRPYQKEGLSWLQNLTAHEAGGILADDMGLGKTLQTISHIATEREKHPDAPPTIVVVPTSLSGNWQREIKKFAPFLKTLVIRGAKRHSLYSQLEKVDVVITTYPVLVRDQERFLEAEFHLLVLDEAQAIKNSRSLAAEAVNSLQAKHKLCLTGTPVENNLKELWSLFNFLMPGFLGNASQFKSRYQTPIEKERNEDRLEQLRERVAPHILRRMKDTVAKDLPPKTELVRPVELDGDQRDLYESIRLSAHSEVRSVIRKKGLSQSTITILDALMKLRQACCDPRLINSDIARDVRRSSKYEFLLELTAQQLEQGRRILIFSQFTQMLSLIAQGLKESGIGYIGLTGATQDRQARCDEFEGGKADVFLISLKAGGTGLNLTSADTVIHYDPWWNPAAQAQATDRAYRIGQTKPVFVYNLIVAGSVEERMLKLQQHKRHLANTILGTADGASFSEEEVDDLFRPLDG